MDIIPQSCLREWPEFPVAVQTLYLTNIKVLNFTPLLSLLNLESLTTSNGSFDGIAEIRSYLLSLFSECSFDMPETDARLHTFIPEQRIVTKQVSKNIAGYGTVKAAPIIRDGNTLNWTHRTTVYDEVQISPSPTIITVKFLNGTEKHRIIVKSAAYAWAFSGNLSFNFLQPGESGESDIRVKFEYNHYREVTTEVQIADGEEVIVIKPTGKTFNQAGKDSYTPPTEKHQLVEYSEFWSVYGTRAKNDEYKNQATMHFTANFDRATALHEFGHALGLAHEHLSPKFFDYFDWEDKESIYSYYEEKDGWSEEDVDKNLFNTVTVAQDLRGVDYDKDSIMTYRLPANFITAQPGAPQWAQEAAEFRGIERRDELSIGDKNIIGTLYPYPIQLAVTALISVHGKDDESKVDFGLFEVGQDDEWYDNRHDPFSLEFNYTYFHPLGKYVQVASANFTWGGECRVEVYLCMRNVRKPPKRARVVEVGVFALLYEEDDEWNDDLEDIVCATFSVQLSFFKTVSLDRLVNRDGLNEIKFGDTGCSDLYEHDELYLGDASGGGDWADVTVHINTRNISLGQIQVETPASPRRAEFDSRDSSLETPRRAFFWDVNSDEEINVVDLVLVSNALGQTNPANPRLDVNGDGIVTIADLVLVAQYLGQSTYSSAPVVVVVPMGLQYSTVAGWIDQARAADDGSLVFREGISKLEYLMTLLIPEETALLHNYPNPFNPETWIPYHLSKPAEVTLTIYSIDGKVVRTLALGHQAAGYYQNKNRAAYWDGRNTVGERVASGVYFYMLTAGDFAATGKMLIMK